DTAADRAALETFQERPRGHREEYRGLEAAQTEAHRIGEPKRRYRQRRAYCRPWGRPGHSDHRPKRRTLPLGDLVRLVNVRTLINPACAKVFEQLGIEVF